MIDSVSFLELLPQLFEISEELIVIIKLKIILFGAVVRREADVFGFIAGILIVESSPDIPEVGKSVKESLVVVHDLLLKLY